MRPSPSSASERGRPESSPDPGRFLRTGPPLALADASLRRGWAVARAVCLAAVTGPSPIWSQLRASSLITGRARWRFRDSHWYKSRGVLALVAMLALKPRSSRAPSKGGTASARSWALYSAAGGRLRRDRVLFWRARNGAAFATEKNTPRTCLYVNTQTGCHAMNAYSISYLPTGVLFSELLW